MLWTVHKKVSYIIKQRTNIPEAKAMEKEENVTESLKTLNEIGFILSTHYEIITLCLQDLPNDTLIALATVCKSWYHVVQSLLKKRTKLRIHFVCEKRKKTSLRLQDINASMRPVQGTRLSLCFAFATVRGLQSAPKHQTQVFEEMEMCLPPSCKRLISVSDGILCSSADSAIEVVHRTSSGFCAATIPQISGVEAILFKVHTPPVADIYYGNPQLPMFEIYREGQSHMFSKLGCELLPQPVKCVLLFSLYESYSLIPLDVYNLITSRQSEGFAFGGCVARSNFMLKTDNTAPNCGVFLYGENLQAASIIISEDCRQEAQIEAKLLELKNCNFPLKNSLAFMFSCVGRRDIKRQTQIFRNIFPDTPLIGLIGNGELGVDYLPNRQQDPSERKLKRRRPDVEHCYSSSLVLLSWHDDKT